MRFLNIGPLELLFVFLLALILLGPAQMVKLAKDAGKTITRVTRSPFWRSLIETSHEIQNLKQTVLREANLNREHFTVVMEEQTESSLPKSDQEAGDVGKTGFSG